MSDILPTDWAPGHSIIKVIGVGGGGCNAVTYMYNQKIEGCDFIVCNTDSQALQKSPVPTKLQLGEGLGAGCDPVKGRNAALQAQEKAMGEDAFVQAWTAMNARRQSTQNYPTLFPVRTGHSFLHYKSHYENRP